MGPVFNDRPTDDGLLAMCYAEPLRLAAEVGATSMGFPNISTGVYRFPKERACGVAFDAVRTWLEGNPGTSLNRVVFCCFDADNTRLYQSAIASV